jgi:hypothetical protein
MEYSKNIITLSLKIRALMILYNDIGERIYPPYYRLFYLQKKRMISEKISERQNELITQLRAENII